MTDAGVVDGPVDDARHARAPAGHGRFTCSPSLTNSWPTVMTVSAVGQARHPHAVGPVGNDLHRQEAHDAVLDRAHADDAVVVEHQNARRDFLRLHMAHGNMDVGAHAVAQICVRDWAARLRRGRCASRRRRWAATKRTWPCTVSPVTSVALAGSPTLIFAHFAVRTPWPTARNGSGAISKRAFVARAHVIADIDIAVVDEAVERRA